MTSDVVVVVVTCLNALVSRSSVAVFTARCLPTLKAEHRLTYQVVARIWFLVVPGFLRSSFAWRLFWKASLLWEQFHKGLFAFLFSASLGVLKSSFE